jgi:hypothetical protein
VSSTEPTDRLSPQIVARTQFPNSFFFSPHSTTMSHPHQYHHDASQHAIVLHIPMGCCYSDDDDGDDDGDIGYPFSSYDGVQPPQPSLSDDVEDSDDDDVEDAAAVPCQRNSKEECTNNTIRYKNDGSFFRGLRQLPPFTVTATYLWTQFNVSFLLQQQCPNQPQHQNPFNHFPHHSEMIASFLWMNILVLSFSIIAWIYRCPSFLYSTPTKLDDTNYPQKQQQQQQRTRFFPELITIVTLVLLMLRWRATALNVLSFSILYMCTMIWCRGTPPVRATKQIIL